MKSSRPFFRHFSHSKAGDLLNLLFLMLVAAFMILPLIYIVSNSFKIPSELYQFPPTFFPKTVTFDNYKSLGHLMRNFSVPLSRYVFNSVVYTAVGITGNIIFASMAAYRLSKRRVPGSKLLFRLVVLALMFSSSVTSIPNYIILSKLNMLDTPWAVIIPAWASTLGLFLMKQFMDQMIPMALLESARIDGAGETKILFGIVMPIVKPAWLTLIIFSFQGIWTNTGGSFIFSEELRTLPYALSTVSADGLARAGSSAVISVIMLIPPITVFLLSQSNVLETMATSGMKE